MVQTMIYLTNQHWWSEMVTRSHDYKTDLLISVVIDVTQLLVIEITIHNAN